MVRKGRKETLKSMLWTQYRQVSKQYGCASQKVKVELLHDLYTQRQYSPYVEKRLSPHAHCSAIHGSQEMGRASASII